MINKKKKKKKKSILPNIRKNINKTVTFTSRGSLLGPAREDNDIKISKYLNKKKKRYISLDHDINVLDHQSIIFLIDKANIFYNNLNYKSAISASTNAIDLLLSEHEHLIIDANINHNLDQNTNQQLYQAYYIRSQSLYQFITIKTKKPIDEHDVSIIYDQYIYIAIADFKHLLYFKQVVKDQICYQLCNLYLLISNFNEILQLLKEQEDVLGGLNNKTKTETTVELNYINKLIQLKQQIINLNVEKKNFEKKNFEKKNVEQQQEKAIINYYNSYLIYHYNDYEIYYAKALYLSTYTKNYQQALINYHYAIYFLKSKPKNINDYILIYYNRAKLYHVLNQIDLCLNDYQLVITYYKEQQDLGLKKIENIDISLQHINDEYQQIKITKSYKNLIKKANHAFIKAKDYMSSIRLYTKALKYYTQLKDNQMKIISGLLANRSLCELYLKNYQACINDCNKALSFIKEKNQQYYMLNIRLATIYCYIGQHNQGLLLYQKIYQEIQSNNDIDQQLIQDIKHDIDMLLSFK